MQLSGGGVGAQESTMQEATACVGDSEAVCTALPKAALDPTKWVVVGEGAVHIVLAIADSVTPGDCRDDHQEISKIGENSAGLVKSATAETGSTHLLSLAELSRHVLRIPKNVKAARCISEQAMLGSGELLRNAMTACGCLLYTSPSPRDRG